MLLFEQSDLTLEAGTKSALLGNPDEHFLKMSLKKKRSANRETNGGCQVTIISVGNKTKRRCSKSSWKGGGQKHSEVLLVTMFRPA